MQTFPLGKSGPCEILFCTPQLILSHIFQAITVWQGKGDLNATISRSLKMDNFETPHPPGEFASRRIKHCQCFLGFKRSRS
jgi:hypothetical protein